MKKKKIIAILTCIAAVVCMLIFLINSSLHTNDNHKGESNEIGESTEGAANNKETTKDNDSSSGDKVIGTHFFWYDSEGNHLLLDDFLNMDISVNNKTINLSLNMIKSNVREVKAYILVFVGGIIHNFYIDDELYEVYEYMQDDKFESRQVDVSIPIDDVEVAYDNTVRVMYMLSDIGIPPVGEKRWYLASERIMTIKDLEISEFVGDDEVEYVPIEGTNMQEINEYYGYSENDIATEKVSAFDSEVPNKFYNYNISNKNDKYISYMIVDDTLNKEGICYSIIKGQAVRKQMEYDDKPHSIQTLVIPIGNYELGVETTLGTYRVN